MSGEGYLAAGSCTISCVSLGGASASSPTEELDSMSVKFSPETGSKTGCRSCTEMALISTQYWHTALWPSTVPMKAQLSSKMTCQGATHGPQKQNL